MISADTSGFCQGVKQRQQSACARLSHALGVLISAQRTHPSQKIRSGFNKTHPSACEGHIPWLGMRFGQQHSTQIGVTKNFWLSLGKLVPFITVVPPTYMRAIKIYSLLRHSNLQPTDRHSWIELYCTMSTILVGYHWYLHKCQTATPQLFCGRFFQISKILWMKHNCQTSESLPRYWCTCIKAVTVWVTFGKWRICRRFRTAYEFEIENVNSINFTSYDRVYPNRGWKLPTSKRGR